MGKKKKKRADTRVWIPGEMNTVRQQQKNAVKLRLPMLSCVCSRVLSHSAARRCQLAPSLSPPLSLHCASLVTLVHMPSCVYVC